MTTLITIVLATPPIRLTTGAADRSQQTGARGRWSRILILEPPAAALQLGDASRDATPPALRTAPRDHILNHEGLTAIWAACDKMGWPFGPFVKLLIATGQRRDEVAHMAWSDLDLERRRWILPRELTKAERVHEVPLNNLAMEIIRECPQLGTWVFPANRVESKNPVSGFSKFERKLDRVSAAQRATPAPISSERSTAPMAA
jgi:integrase